MELFRPGTSEMIASIDNVANKYLPPPQIRALPWREQVEWARAHQMKPTAEAEAAHAKNFLERASERLRITKQQYPGGEYLRAFYSMFEMMQPFMDQDAPAVTAAANTALTQDTIFTVPANTFSVPGKALWLHAVGVLTTTATPGTYTFILKWGGVGGVTLATTGAIAPAAVVNTNTLWFADFYLKARATGATATALTLTAYGVVESPTWLVATTQALSGVNYAPPNTGTPGTALADITGLDGTIAKALTLTVTPSVATGSIALRDGWIVALN
jgi:hypothetical protein